MKIPGASSPRDFDQIWHGRNGVIKSLALFCIELKKGVEMYDRNTPKTNNQ
jgi:hypothetical protein